MKVMHKPEITARVKVEEYLEKEGKELVAFSYGTANTNDKRFYVGIAYESGQGKDAPPDRNRYEIVIYDTVTEQLAFSTACLYYENALIEMGQRIRRRTYEN